MWQLKAALKDLLKLCKTLFGAQKSLKSNNCCLQCELTVQYSNLKCNVLCISSHFWFSEVFLGMYMIGKNKLRASVCSFLGCWHVCVKWACFAFCYECNQYKDIYSFIRWYTLSGVWKQLLLCMKESYEYNRESVGAACIMRFYAMCQCSCLRLIWIFRVPFIASCTTYEIITKRSSREICKITDAWSRLSK